MKNSSGVRSSSLSRGVSFARARRERAQPIRSPLSSRNLSLKIFFAPGPRIDPAELQSIFETWPRDGSMFSADFADGRPGLVYARRRGARGSTGERLRASLAALFAAARSIEVQTGLLFMTDEIELRIDDRMLAPNTRETYDRIEGTLRAFSLLLFEGAELEPISALSPKGVFRVRLRAAKRRAIPDLLMRLVALRARELLMS